VLFATEDGEGIGDFGLTPDGESLVIRTRGTDIAYRDRESDSTVWLLTSDAAELAPTLSPDGHWLAYTSSVTGELEVFVRPFPDVMGSRTQVSIDGGTEPVWGRRGATLYYKGPDSLMAASYTAEERFVVTGRESLFDTGDFINRAGSRSYDVSASGRFVFVQNAETVDDDEGGEQAIMILVENWFTELRELLGGGD
jgi:Tol biopolymer transport system component